MRRSAELSKLRDFVTGGARGVRLKLKALLSCALAESRGLILDGRRRLYCFGGALGSGICNIESIAAIVFRGMT